MIRKIVKFMMILLCMGTIFFLSSDTATSSSKKSNYVIVRMTESFFRRKLNSQEKKYYKRHLVKIVRKTAHFSLYFLLGLLVLSFSLEYIEFSWKPILVTILFVFIYACSDEIHQLFIPGRSGELFDVFIDTCGGFFSVIVYNCYYKVRRRYYEQKKATC